MNMRAGKRGSRRPIMHSAKSRITFSNPARKYCRRAAGRSRSRTARAATACGSPNKPSISFRSIFRQRRRAKHAIKWRGMRRTLKSGGVLIIQGYTPKQLQYGTGGPKQLENLYTRAMLEREFGDFRDLKILEEEREMREGASHAGMSAVIGLTAIRP